MFNAEMFFERIGNVIAEAGNSVKEAGELQTARLERLIRESNAGLNARIDAMDARLSARIDATNTRMEKGFDKVNARFDEVDARLDRLESSRRRRGK